MRLISTCSDLEPGTWELHRNRESDSGEWKNFVLVRPAEAAKRNEQKRAVTYRFGWNGQRLARGHLGQIGRKHRKILTWIREVLQMAEHYQIASLSNDTAQDRAA